MQAEKVAKANMLNVRIGARIIDTFCIFFDISAFADLAERRRREKRH